MPTLDFEEARAFSAADTMNPNKRPPPSSVGAFEGGDGLRDATKRARDFPDGKILRPGQEQPGNVLLVRVTDIVHPVRD